MAKRRIVFHKNFTRDTSLILQQLWPLCMEDGLKELAPPNPHRPAVIDYINQGTCEIWENDEAVAFIRRRFRSYCRKQPQRASAFLKDYAKQVEAMERIWKKKALPSLGALQKFISLVRENMTGDLFILYMAEEKGIPESVRKLAFELRDGDHYFSASNQLFIATLKRLYPRLGAYVSVIGLDDLDNIPKLVELKKRFRNYVCVGRKGKIETLEAYAKRHREYVFVREKADLSRGKIVGQTASPGKAVGRARLVYTTHDLKKVKPGDILVSPMTTANFMPAILKAAAIITNEGGVICHAAIVSRELKKPCLIATKAATEYFKDGERIEVNASAGWARKL